MTHPSYCCSKCGEQIGYIGRLFQFLRIPLHRCEDTSQTVTRALHRGTRCLIIVSYTQDKLQMTIEITNQIRIQEHQDFWYTVEDTHLDVGCDGCTISYWEEDSERGDKRIQHICMGKEESLAVADAIYKLFKVN